MTRQRYESDAKHFDADAYTVDGHRGIAWHILGWQTEPDENTEWTGVEPRTGKVVARMVGDDCHFLFDEDELTPLQREEYCGECGQIGCCHDGMDRSAS